MIYFLGSPDGTIKIGATRSLCVRLKALQLERGERLEVLGVMDGWIEAENELHQRFCHLRIGGEWFEPGDDLRRFIAAKAKPWDGRDERPRYDPTLMVTKIDRGTAMKLKCVADIRGIKLVELLGEVLAPIVDREFAAAIPDEALRIRMEAEMEQAMARHMGAIRLRRARRSMRAAGQGGS